MSQVAALILRYDEPGWTKATIDCVRQSALHKSILCTSRGGVGAMSAAFNRGMRHIAPDVKYTWMITNVTFNPAMFLHLVDVMEQNPKCAAIHPAFMSDHPHIRPTNKREVREVPYIEWTAPMVRMEAWNAIGELDEQMPYWGMDLDWSYRAKQAGWNLLVSDVYLLKHTYLRACSECFDVTRRRALVRAKHDVSTENRLREKWGDDWMRKLWPCHHRAGQGRIYT